MPKRIQMKRTKGWRKPEGAVYVGRPTRWGNPFQVGGFVTKVGQPTPSKVLDRAMAVALFKGMFYDCLVSKIAIRKIKKELRGKDLACWCPLDQPCHADVLLEIANKGAD